MKPYFVARRGFANYHFNQFNQNRIWNSYISQTKPDEIGGDWTLRGKLGNLGNASIVLTNTRVDADLPQGKAFAVLENDLGTQEAPRGSGGLLVVYTFGNTFSRRDSASSAMFTTLARCPLPSMRKSRMYW